MTIEQFNRALAVQRELDRMRTYLQLVEDNGVDDMIIEFDGAALTSLCDDVACRVYDAIRAALRDDVARLERLFREEFTQS